MTTNKNPNRRDVLPERFNKAKQAINQKYRIADYAKSLGISVAPWGQQTCCPFHDDSTPSFSVDPERNIFNCFGCGRGGSFIDFYLDAQVKFKDRKLSRYDAVQEILSQDKEIQSSVGYTTIFETYDAPFVVFDDKGEFDIDKLVVSKPKIIEREITMKHVMDKVLRADIDTKLNFIADCEKGMSVSFLIKKYYHGEIEIPKIAFDTSEDVTSMFEEAFNLKE